MATLKKFVYSDNGNNYSLEEYRELSNKVLMDKEPLTLEEAKEKLYEYNENAEDYTEEIEECKSVDELGDLIYEEDLGKIENTYNYSWWGGVRQFIVVHNDGDKFDADYSTLIFVSKHRGGDVRGNYEKYEAFDFDDGYIFEDFPIYADRLTYEVTDDNGKTARFSTEDMEGYDLYVDLDKTGKFKEDDSTNTEKVQEAYGLDNSIMYSWGGGIAVGGLLGGYLGYKIGRARPQKTGFDTEKKIARNIKAGAKKVKDDIKEGAEKRKRKKLARSMGRGGKISKDDAIIKALKMGVDFDKDFHAQSFGNELSELAKESGYRKSRSASGSLGRAFFEHLERIYDKNKSYYNDMANDKYAKGGKVEIGQRVSVFSSLLDGKGGGYGTITNVDSEGVDIAMDDGSEKSYHKDFVSELGSPYGSPFRILDRRTKEGRRKMEQGGKVIETFTSIQGSRVMPNNPFTIEKENDFYVIKNSKGEVLAKDTTKEGIMNDKGMFLNLYKEGGLIVEWFDKDTNYNTKEFDTKQMREAKRFFYKKQSEYLKPTLKTYDNDIILESNYKEGGKLRGDEIIAYQIGVDSYKKENIKAPAQDKELLDFIYKGKKRPHKEQMELMEIWTKARYDENENEMKKQFPELYRNGGSLDVPNLNDGDFVSTYGHGGSLKSEEFTMQDALDIQKEQLAKWQMVLKDDVYNDLYHFVSRMNSKGYKSPYNVFRGTQIDGYIANYMLGHRMEHFGRGGQTSFDVQDLMKG